METPSVVRQIIFPHLDLPWQRTASVQQLEAAASSSAEVVLAAGRASTTENVMEEGNYELLLRNGDPAGGNHNNSGCRVSLRSHGDAALSTCLSWKKSRRGAPDTASTRPFAALPGGGCARPRRCRRASRPWRP